MRKLFHNIGNVLRSWRFLLNLAVILVATSWIPLMARTITMRDSEGNIIQEATETSRLYESWWAVVRVAPGVKAHAQAALFHLGICFAIAFVVWYIALNSTKHLPVPTQTMPPENGQNALPRDE